MTPEGILYSIQAMLRGGVLYTKRCKGEYCDFDILKICQDAGEYFKVWQGPELTGEQIQAAYRRLRLGDRLKGYEAGAPIRYIGEINQVFQDAPKEAVMYARMQKDAAVGTGKKILLLYLRKTKEKAGTQAAMKENAG